MKLIASFCLALAALAGFSSFTHAQHLDYHNGHYHWHRNVPHFHDAAGHMVDRFGHHIDGHGNHTRIGVYENGSISRYSNIPGVLGSPYDYGHRSYAYYPSYSLYDNDWGYRAFYPVGPSGVLAAPSNSLPPVSRVVIGDRTSTQKPTRWPSRGKVVISNPRDSGADLHYTLNGSVFTIKPGYQQTIEDDRNWVVAFGSGGGKGDMKYTLMAGKYKFVATESGWDLKLVNESPPASPSGDIPPPLPSPE